MQAQKVILIYELIPDATQIYNLEIDDESILNKLKECHGQYANSSVLEDEHPANIFLPDYLESKKDRKVFDSGSKELGIQPPIHLIANTILIHTGFFC